MTCIRLSSKHPSEMGHHVLQWKSSDQKAHYSKNFHTMNNILQKTSVKHLLHAEWKWPYMGCLNLKTGGPKYIRLPAVNILQKNVTG